MFIGFLSIALEFVPGHPQGRGVVCFDCFALSTASSLYAGASRSSKVIAFVGQAGRQSPRPTQ